MTIDRVINQAIWEHQANTKGFPNNEYLNDLEKIRKVLEIIKKKGICEEGFFNTDIVKEYNAFIDTGACRWNYIYYTKEEYDLLKEVLL